MKNEITYQNQGIKVSVNSEENISDIKELFKILPLRQEIRQETTKHIETKAAAGESKENNLVKQNQSNSHTYGPNKNESSEKSNYNLPPLWLVECEECGKVTFLNRNTCSDDVITCKNCNDEIEIDESMVAPAEYCCECGKKYKIGIYSDSDTVTVNCRECQTPIDLVWNEKKRRYEKM